MAVCRRRRAGAAAAYCLYLHHLALGESDTADWWHRQTDDVQPPPGRPLKTLQPQSRSSPSAWHPADHRITNTSTTTILRILRHLAKYSARPRSAAVTELMAYVPTAVAVGYLRQPEMDLPTPALTSHAGSAPCSPRLPTGPTSPTPSRTTGFSRACLPRCCSPPRRTFPCRDQQDSAPAGGRNRKTVNTAI
ncbi:hypothetical protein SAV14893_097700 [Streptomyces avermitilis]|uniref:Uncharacterized protein n=1 Tax=Streptomyces avermitilis TaxID=33903 RepID=A0A4D4MGG2_STRAX|nr:hypothetical protein SAV14893_097700 [Streptomyces avermitilis]